MLLFVCLLWQEMREHVVKFLVETEQSYVESLRRILKVSCRCIEVRVFFSLHTLKYSINCIAPSLPLPTLVPSSSYHHSVYTIVSVTSPSLPHASEFLPVSFTAY